MHFITHAACNQMQVTVKNDVSVRICTGRYLGTGWRLKSPKSSSIANRSRTSITYETETKHNILPSLKMARICDGQSIAHDTLSIAMLRHCKLQGAATW